MTESDALERLRQGKDVDEAAQVLFGPMEGPLLGHFCHLTRNWHDAQEICQSAFVYAFLHIRRFDPTKASLYHWLATIGYGYFKMMCRGRKRAKNYRERLALTDPEYWPGPEEVHEAHARQDELWAMLEHLPVYEMAAVELHIGERLSYPEIGRELGIAPRMAKTYAWRGLHILRLLYHLAFGRHGSSTKEE
jgi:RNA polymerase sigma factor (sigma-70 family)